MNTYHTALICENGHTISNDYESLPNAENENFCEKCGAKTFTACPNCNAPIHGRKYIDGYPGVTPKQTPAFCYACGEPYPWTVVAMAAVKDAVLEDPAVSGHNIIDLLPDIVSETPRTATASKKVAELMKLAGKFTSDTIRYFVIEFGCEIAKSYFGF